MIVDFTKLNRLPSLPVVAIRLLEKFTDPNVALPEIVRIVQTDPAITAKLLRAVNSAQYGAGRPVSDLNRAVNLLGKKAVTSLVLCFSLSEESMCRGAFASLYKSVWLQSIVQASAAEQIARRHFRGMEGEAFTIALLADIGRLAMLKTAPQEYAAVVDRSAREGLSLEQCEEEAFGIDHRRLSLALLNHWNLPKRFSNAICRRTSAPDQLASLPADEERAMTFTTALATTIADYFCISPRGLSFALMADLGAELFGMTPDNIDALLKETDRAVKSTSELFETDPSQLGSPTDLMAEAMEQLCAIASSVHDGQTEASVRSRLLDENGQLKQRIQDLVQRSCLDALTGVFNRGSFDEQFTLATADAMIKHDELGLLFLDADHFKKINDEYGHPAGDAVLKRLATVLTSAVREGDIVARYGGEEFVVLLNKPSLAGLESLAERIRAAVEAERIPVDGGGVIRVTISIGGALFVAPHSDDTPGNLLVAADSALYEAKDSGRNRVLIRHVHQCGSEMTASDR
ncbi:putative diguanylate cyclase YcdT [Caulifigura coniformis]|uniref:diguanylate cyclase n=1 Tax=Caulifigura coniformis TaxID=2527983 RepID=A0A517SJL0_9PLAN|nr:GGDEF domain-containing protein [Caulifigura coniformis]QDT56312.1 putative diguanylate cyclase YcdT [Caulifigura coniformis]